MIRVTLLTFVDNQATLDGGKLPLGLQELEI